MEQTQIIEKVRQILNRKQYKKIKTMDRAEMEKYLAAIYILGHEAGEEKQQEQEKPGNETPAIIHLIDDMYCGDIKGIGIATVNKIQDHARARGYI